MATHSRILAWRIPGTGEPGGLPSVGRTESDTTECACILSHISHVLLFATLWTTVFQAPLSMGFSPQKYWSGLP